MNETLKSFLICIGYTLGFIICAPIGLLIIFIFVVLIPPISIIFLLFFVKENELPKILKISNYFKKDLADPAIVHILIKIAK